MRYKYPRHFYDPMRIEIAVSQIQHEFRKLFPSLSLDQWDLMDRDISEWFCDEKFELEEAHDFWNFFGGVARGLKLKSLLFWVTASNVLWSKEEVFIRDIVMTWDYPGFSFMGKAPYPAEDLIKKFSQKDMANRKESMANDEIERSKKYAPRDHFPIVLFHDPKGGILNKFPGYYVLEGNRRTARSVLLDNNKILAFVGRFKKEEDFWPEDYWFRTGILRDLIFLSNYYNKARDGLGFRVVRSFYQLLMRDLNIVRFATFDKTFKDFERNERLLKEIMIEDLR
jgi:hypothetical protein